MWRVCSKSLFFRGSRRVLGRAKGGSIRGQRCEMDPRDEFTMTTDREDTERDRVQEAGVELDRSQTRRNFWVLVAAQAAASGYLALRSGFLGALVATTTTSALAITFAVTVHRWVVPVVAPVIGRLSDVRSDGGRRRPFMSWGLMTIGISLWAMAVVPRNYWTLAALAALAALGWAAYRIPRFSATPDLFGQKVWAGMVVSFALAGAGPNFVVQATVARTWDRNASISFGVAAAACSVGALAVWRFLEEPKISQAEAAASAQQMSLRERVRFVISERNLLVLLAAGGIVTIAASPVAPLYVVYAGRVLGVGPRTVATAAIVGGLVSLPLIPFVALLAARLPRKAAGVGCATLGVALAVCAYQTSSIVTLTVLGVITELVGVAVAVSLGTLLLDLFPRKVLAEIAGMWTAATTVGSVTVSYITSVAVEASGNWRLIWIPLVLGSAGALVALSFLDIPATHRRLDLSDLRRSLRRGFAVGLRGIELRHGSDTPAPRVGG